MKARHSKTVVPLAFIALSGVLAIASVFASTTNTDNRKEGFWDLGSKRQEPPESIFVSVASYRDEDCMATLKHMYEQAEHPGRIFVGICEQNTGSVKESCVPASFQHWNNVRKITIPHKEALGPCYARYLCSTLYRGERWFMQIDSHTRFARHWDTKATTSVRQCPSANAVLTGYPHDYIDYGIDETSVPMLCDSYWNRDGLPQFKAIIRNKADFKHGPLPVPFTSGGFIFAPGKMLADIGGYDPKLPHLFQGEEILFSARAWTHGYDFFTAPVNIVFHKYYRRGEPKFWEDIPDRRPAQRTSMTRARRILGLEQPVIPPGSEPHALGTKRSVEAYWTFAGLDPASKSSTSKTKFCASSSS
jgi:hypothetical protein